MAGHIIYVHATIPASQQEVWDVITDVAHTDKVLRSVHDSTLVSEGDFGVGTTWREKRNIFGHRGEEELRVVECEPPGSVVVETTLGRDVVRTSYRVTAFGEAGDSTRLAMTTSVQMKDRSLWRRLTWKFFGGFSYEHTHRMLEHDLADITAEVARRKQVAA